MISKKIMESVVDTLVSKGGDFGELFLETNKSLGIQIENQKIEKITSGNIQGAGMRLKYGERIFYGYTEDLSEKGLLTLARDLSLKGKGTGTGMTVVTDSPMSKDYILGADGGDLEDRIKLLTALNEKAWKSSDKLTQVMLVYGDVESNVYIMNSKGVYVRDQRPRVRMVAQGIVKEGDSIQSAYDAMGGLATYEWLREEDLEGLVTGTMQKAENLLSAKEAPSGQMAVVLSGEAGGTMVHEACGHGLEGDIVKKGMSVYGGKVGEQVASSLITVVDDGTIVGKYGSGYYDDEGTKTRKNVLIENGVLKGYIADAMTAEELGIEPTGNGRRQSYQHLPITRMTNTYIASGDDNKEDIVASVEEGIFVKKMGGGQVNTTTGDFVFEVSEGYLIKDGKVGEQVRGATLIGNGPEVLTKIDKVGSDFGYSLGVCGKDGQGVPVADAQPTLRIPSLTVGGTQNG